MKIPKLRFKEFSGEWEEKKLEKELKEYYLGSNYKNSENKTSFPLLKMGNLERGKINLKKIEYIDESEIILEKDKVKYGDLFFNTRNTPELVGKVAIWRNELPLMYFNSNLMKMTFDNNFFMNYKFNTKNMIEKLKSIATGTTSVGAIYTKDLLKLDLLIPNLQEQEKIADFLSSVDKKISITEEKLNLFKEYKKGMMQKIFKQEIRFKDENGNNYPDWEEKRLGDIGDIKGGKRLPKGSSLISKKNNFPYITVSDFENKSVNLKNIKYVPIEIVEKIKNYRIYTDEIYISVAGTLGLVGKIPQELNGANLTENADKLTNIKINQDYLLHSLCTNTIQEEIEREKTNNAQPKLALAKIKEFKIQVPCLEEQEKIANFLSSIDNKIENLSNELENLKEFKKGLLQKMFI